MWGPAYPCGTVHRPPFASAEEPELVTQFENRSADIYQTGRADPGSPPACALQPLAGPTRRPTISTSTYERDGAVYNPLWVARMIFRAREHGEPRSIRCTCTACQR